MNAKGVGIMGSRKQNPFIKLNTQKLGTKKILISQGLDAETQLFYKNKLNLLNKIDAFRESYMWLKKKTAIDRMKTYHKYHFDINKCLEVYPDVSRTSFETSVWHGATKFKEAIGVRTLDLIEQDMIDVADHEFRLATGDLKLSGLIPSEVINLLPEPNLSRNYFYATECQREIKVLKQLTHLVLQQVIGRLDEEKLSLLRYILESGDPQFTKQRNLIYKFFESDDMSLDQLLVQLEETEYR